MMPPINGAHKRKLRETTELAMTLPARNTRRLRQLTLVTLLALMAGGCATVNLDSHQPASAEEALSLAASEEQAATAQDYLLRAAQQFQQQDNHVAARTLLVSDHFRPFASDALKRRHQRLAMTSAVALKDESWAQALTADLPAEYFLNYESGQMQAVAELQARTLKVAGKPLEAAYTLMSLVMNDPDADSQRLHNEIWRTLAQVPAAQLRKAESSAIGYETEGWIKLALTLSDPKPGLDQQGRAIRSWQNNWPAHPAAAILPSDLALIASLSEQQPERIALAVPLTGPLANAGQAIKDGFLAAYYQDDNKDELDILVVDSAKKPFKELYQELIQQDRELIVGPLKKEKLAELSNMHTLPVPVLGLNYLQDAARIPEGLFQFGLAPEDEARQIADRMSQDGIRQALALVPEGDWGNRVAGALQAEADAINSRLLSIQRYFPEDNLRAVTAQLLGINASRERAIDVERTAGMDVEFEPRRRQDAQAIIMVAGPEISRQFNPLFAFYFGGDLPVYSPSLVYEGTEDPSRDRDLNGVMFTDIPWILLDEIPLRNTANAVFPDMTGGMHRLFAMGADSWQLAKRLQFLQQVEGARLQGHTGQLTMSDDGAIVREQLWARFTGGTPELMTRPEEQYETGEAAKSRSL